MQFRFNAFTACCSGLSKGDRAAFVLLCIFSFVFLVFDRFQILFIFSTNFDQSLYSLLGGEESFANYFYYSFGTNERRLCAWSLCYDAWSTQLEDLLVRRTRFSNSMDIVSGKRLGEIVRLSQTIMRNLIWYFFAGGIYFSPSWRPNCSGVLWPASRNGPEVRALDRPVLWYPERSSLIVARRSTADIR